MATPLMTGNALDAWNRYSLFGTKPTTPAPAPPPVQPGPEGPTVAPMPPNPQSYDSSQDPNIDYGDTHTGARKWAGDLETEKTRLDAAKPGEVSATYQGPEAMSMNWGGALIGGSKTGVEDYGNWRTDRANYTQALQKWQQEYDSWAKSKAEWDRLNPPKPAPGEQQQAPAPGPTSGEAYWGKASTQQQSLGQSPTTQPQNPYAVPGQRSTQQPGTGQVQKPDKTLGKVNPRYAGVL